MRSFWPDEWRRWARSWRLRPLLWIALALSLGSALGPRWAAQSGATTRDEMVLLWPLLPALCCALAAWQWRGTRCDTTKLACFFAFALAMTCYAAWRVLPPRDDVSNVLRAQMRRDGPLRPISLTLRGQVVDEARRGDFSLSFALQIEPTLIDGRRVTGRVRVEAPGQSAVGLGDQLSVRGELLDLASVGSAVERDRKWSDLLDGCWCRLKITKARDMRLLRSGGGWAGVVAQMRGAISRRYERAFGADESSPDTPNGSLRYAYGAATAQLLTAMVFGESGLREPLPRLTREQFRAAGLSHLLVASGTQISFLACALAALSRFHSRRGMGSLILIVAILLLYAIIAGGAASIWRATIAGALGVWAAGLGRAVDALSLWCLALATLLIFDPLRLFDLSLQLTFAATWGLIALAPAIDRRLEIALGDFPGRFFIALSLGAQLAVLPVAAYHFGRLSLAGFAANLPAVPLAGILVATGILGLILPLAPLNYALTQAVAATASWASRLPGAGLETKPLSLPLALVFYAAWSVIILSVVPSYDWRETLSAARDEWQRWMGRQRQSYQNHRRLFFGVVLMAMLVLAWNFGAGREKRLRLSILDVGQGESLVVRSPSGRVMLVDGGSLDSERGDIGRSVIVPYLQSIGVTRIDVLVITHADADHCNGLREVARAIPIGLVLDGAARGNNTARDLRAADYNALIDDLKRRQIPIQAARGGQSFDLGAGVAARVLSPTEPRLKSNNDNATVLRLDFGQTSALLTADIEAAAEKRLLSRGADVRCTLLKVAHHGSKTSSTPPFLRAVAPQMALISCGRYNRFGHPAAPTLQSLDATGAPIFRTDLDGTIEVACDGQSCTAQTFRR